MSMHASFPAVLKQAERVLADRQAALSNELVVIRQRLDESPEALARRVENARARTEKGRPIVVACMTGALKRQPNVCVVDIPARCYQVLHPSVKARFKVLKGGRGAAKSWSIARALLVMALERPISVLCCREIQSSIRASVHKVLRRQIDALGLSRWFNVDVRAITAYNGSTFDFEGLFANQDRIKSFEAVNICWIEEAASISAESWEILEPTLREPGSFFAINYNPDAADAPTHKMFAIEPRPDALVEHLVYTDNPYLTEPLRAAAEYMKRVDPDAYTHVWLGEPRTYSDAQILRGKYVVEEFDPQPHWNGPYLGLDFGFAQDPTAAVKCYVADNTLYISHEAWAIGCDIDATSRLLDTIPEARRHVMRADCARPETISYLQSHGYGSVIGVEKWKGSVEDGVAHLRSYERIVIHPRCEHVADEARLYSFKVDRLTRDVLPDIVDRHNHCMDALRYALAPLIQRRGGLLDYYAQELAKDAAAPPQNPWLTANPTMAERVKREGAIAVDAVSPWH